MRVHLRNLGVFLFQSVPMWGLAQGKFEEKEAAQAGKPAEGAKPHQTFTRGGPREFSYVLEFGMQGGAFAPTIEQTCEK